MNNIYAIINRTNQISLGRVMVIRNIFIPPAIFMLSATGLQGINRLPVSQAHYETVRYLAVSKIRQSGRNGTPQTGLALFRLVKIWRCGMANTCITCRHPYRVNIDTELAQGIPVRQLETKYGIGFSSLQRHKENCQPQAVVAHRDLAERMTAETLMATLADVQEKAYAIYHANRGVDDTISLKALQRIDSVVQSNLKIVALAQQAQNARDGQSVADILNAAKKRYGRIKEVAIDAEVVEPDSSQ